MLFGGAATSKSLVDGDARQPGGEGSAGGELAEVRVGANVGVLHDVFGFGVAVQNGSGDAIEALVVAAHDDLVQGGFSRPDAVDDLFVCEAFGLQSFRIFAVSMACFFYRVYGGEKVTKRVRECCFPAADRLIFPVCVTDRTAALFCIEVEDENIRSSPER